MSEVQGGDLNLIDARQALERFVVDNDDLLALEERIGRFNIFDVLGVVRAEIRHSNFLAWLLDPAESHGQGSLFLKAILMDLLKQAPAELRPLSPIELDGEELRGVEIRREWRSIDILIRCEQPPFVIAIENKIDAGPHNPFAQYEERVHEEWPSTRSMFVYLTPEGDDLVEREGWVSYSYRDIHRVLDRVRHTGRGAIGADVSAFLDHYLRLIGASLMDDPGIAELCQRIYKHHRRAIDLVIEHAAAGSSELLNAVEAGLQADIGRWTIFNKTTRRIDFVPTAWLEWLPPHGVKYGIDGRFWLVFIFDTSQNKCWLHMELWPMRDAELRFNIAKRLTVRKDEFGLRVSSLKATTRWNRLASSKLAEWEEDEQPEIEKVVAGTLKKLAELDQRLVGISAALLPIFDEWKESHSGT